MKRTMFALIVIALFGVFSAFTTSTTRVAVLDGSVYIEVDPSLEDGSTLTDGTFHCEFDVTKECLYLISPSAPNNGFGAQVAAQDITGVERDDAEFSWINPY